MRSAIHFRFIIMETRNISRPNQKPEVGDLIEIIHDNGAREKKYYTNFENQPIEKEVVVWTWGDLMELLTPKERKAIRGLAKTDEDVEDVVDMLKSNPFVKGSNKTENRLNLLAEKGCLTTERVTEILK
jgi:hypothetical protein